jgi:hypothetical protein
LSLQYRVSTQLNEGAHGCRLTTEAISILQQRADAGNKPRGNRCCIEQKKFAFSFYVDSQKFALTAQQARSSISQTQVASEYNATINLGPERKRSMRQVQYFKGIRNCKNSFVTFQVKQIKFVFLSRQNLNISQGILFSLSDDYVDCHVEEYDTVSFGRNS